MGDARNYRLECKVVDASTGETIIQDNTFIGTIDEYGGCESVDHTVARMLRQFKKSAQKEYERAL